MMSLLDIQIIIEHCQFRDWEILVKTDGSPGGRQIPRPYLQLQWKAPNNDNLHGPAESQVSRKWWLSYHMCENEIVRTAWMAVRAAVEHEMNEQFTFRGVRIFDPHLDYTVLAQRMQDGTLTQNNRDDQPATMGGFFDGK